MSNERPNEFLPWRGQLTPPDALPEQGLEDKELSWQRLAERLQTEPRRRGIAWWIAAACLILAFFFPATHLFRTRPTHPNRIAHRPPAEREPVPAAPSHPAPASVQSTTSAQSTTSTQSTTSDHHLPISHSNGGENAPIKNFPPANTIPATPAPSSNFNYGEIAAIKPNSPTDTPSTPAGTLLAAIPPPASQPSSAELRRTCFDTALLAPNLRFAQLPHRQLRIIYLNELNKDPGPSVASTRQPAFLHLGTAAATADWTTSQQNIPIIKIEISSSHNH